MDYLQARDGKAGGETSDGFALVAGKKLEYGHYAESTFGDRDLCRRVCYLADEICGSAYREQYDSLEDTEQYEEIEYIIFNAVVQLNVVTEDGVWLFCEGDLVLLHPDWEEQE